MSNEQPFIKESVRLKTITYNSFWYHNNARFLANRALEIEPNPLPPVSESHPSFVEYNACVISSVIQSVMFVESAINEIIADTRLGNCEGQITRPVVENIRTIWSSEKEAKKVDYLSTIAKYDWLMKLCGVASRPNDEHRKNLEDVLSLRNFLTHSRPTEHLFFSEPKVEVSPESIEIRLKDKFRLSPFAEDNSPFYPDKCLSAGCAEFVYTTCAEFVSSYRNELGLPKWYQRSN